MAVMHYRQLIVWQKAMDFAVAIYGATERFPKAQAYRMCDQLQRAAISIPSNIAEGQGRSHTREFLHFLSHANGSLYEAETQIILSQRLGFLTDPEAEDFLIAASEIGRLLNGLAHALQKRLAAAP